MSTWLPALAVGIIAVVSARMSYRAWRRRRVAARRRVEAPNSHYSSELVRSQEDRERWGRINMGGLHPLNRDEVQRLLDVVDQEGVKSISARDRLFLDNMTIPRLG